MRLDWLESFAVFAQELNFTRAARRLHLSQPALHVQIRKLGEHLGRPLYVREGRSLRLTIEGRRTESLARDILERTEALPESVRSGRNEAPLTLCAGEGAYLYLLGHAVRAFGRRGRRPLRLMTGDREATLAAVREGRAQVGVAVNAHGHPELETRALTQVRHALVVPRSHALAKRSWITVESLEGESLVVPPRDKPLRALIAAETDRRAVSWSVAVEATGWEVMIRFVELGVGLAIVNECCNIPGRLAAIPIRDLPTATYHVVTRAGRLEPDVAAVRDALRDHADDWRR